VGADGPTAGRIDAGDHALARGVLYGALALALQPPDPNGVSRLESQDAGQRWATPPRCRRRGRRLRHAPPDSSASA
jgi:hypothetical protein